MESMAEKICLDTDMCIAIINGDSRAEKFRMAAANADLYLSSVTVFELYLRKTNLEKVTEFLSNFKHAILPLDQNCAIEASLIYKDLERYGNLLEFRDIFIASSSILHNCKLASFNKKHFLKIKGLELLNF